MRDDQCIQFLQWALPQLRMRWPGFRKVRGQVCECITRRMADLNFEEISDYRDYLGEHPVEWGVLDNLCQVTRWALAEAAILPIFSVSSPGTSMALS